MDDLNNNFENHTLQELSPSLYYDNPSAINPPVTFCQKDQRSQRHILQQKVPFQIGTYEKLGCTLETGAQAGIDRGFTESDDNITSELAKVYINIQKVIDLRRKYIRLSLQRDGDNPRDEPNWKIYPPPAEPAWYQSNLEDDIMAKGKTSLNSSACSNTFPHWERLQTQNRETQSRISEPIPLKSSQKRELGQDIGEDFNLEDELPVPGLGEMSFRLDENGVYQVYENAKADELDTPAINIPTLREFYMDLDEILEVSSDGPNKTFAFRRLKYLEGKFNLYVLLNEFQEIADSKSVPHRDFYNVRKVDTHIHHSACMNQKHLLRFIKSKMKKCPDEVVLFRDGKFLTLAEVFQSINLTAYDLSIDTLDMHVSRFTWENLTSS